MKILILMLRFIFAYGHGRLLDPPARSSAWREDPIKFPVYYFDNQMFCGGFNTYILNMGRCGICGEDLNSEKQFEKGGVYYRGHIVRTYTQGQLIDVTVQITSNHKGFFEFKICNVDSLNSDATQSCLDKNVLKDNFGRRSIPLDLGITGLISVKLKLPDNFKCDKCVFQWTYRTGNFWNLDAKTKKSCVGCGLQEVFMGCADIMILSQKDPNTLLISTKKVIILDTTQWPPQPPTWPWQRTAKRIKDIKPKKNRPLMQSQSEPFIQPELLEIPIYLNENESNRLSFFERVQNRNLDVESKETNNLTSESSTQTAIPKNWPSEAPTWPIPQTVIPENWPREAPTWPWQTTTKPS